MITVANKNLDGQFKGQKYVQEINAASCMPREALVCLRRIL